MGERSQRAQLGLFDARPVWVPLPGDRAGSTTWTITVGPSVDGSWWYHHAPPGVWDGFLSEGYPDERAARLAGEAHARECTGCGLDSIPW